MLLKFEAKQRIFDVGGVRIGGQPGELPTALIGNLFYKGMPEEINHKGGEFDQKAVLKWIAIAEELSEKTGVPHLLDIMAMCPEAMRKYITFVSEHSDKVFLLDGTNPETRIAGLKTVWELGLQERAIFNAIFPQISEDEIKALRESGVTAAILLAHNEMDFSPEGRITILTGFDEQLGLLRIAKRARVKKVLVDTIVFDVPSIAYAVEAIKLVKNDLGYPAGCSPANATYDWRRSQNELLKGGFAAYNASAHTIAQFSGADFLIYGPIKQAKNIIPACAMNDAIIAYNAIRRLGTKPSFLTTHSTKSFREHPHYVLFFHQNQGFPKSLSTACTRDRPHPSEIDFGKKVNV